MRLFILENYEAKVNKDEVMLIPEFATLFELKYNKQEGDSDGRLRKRGKAELTYMYFMYSYASELRHYSEEDRHKESLYAAGLSEKYKISEELERACNRYNNLQETRSLKLLNSANIAIDRMIEYFKTIDYGRVTNSGVLVNDPAKVSSTLARLEKATDALDKWEKKIKFDLSESSKTRGDQEEGRIK